MLGDSRVIISKKQILGLSPRHEWLRNRVKEVIDSLSRLEEIQDWNAYRETALELSKELNYATVEWGRYYSDNQ